MKKIIISSLVVVLILTVSQIWAQRSPSSKIDHLKTELDLSDDQVVQLEKIFESKHDEMMALKNSDDQTKEQKREAMQSFRQSMETEIQSVLNEDQLAKFEEIKKERKGGHGARGKKMGFHHKMKGGKGEALHAKIKAYKDENIKPVMLEQRAKLEPKISEADKQVIAELRVEFEKMKAERKARFEEKKHNCEPGKEHTRKGMQKERKERIGEEKFEKMKGLVEKYTYDIEFLFGEVEDQQEKWKNDIKEITKSTLDLEEEEMTRGMKRMNENHGNKMEHRRMAHFLLLDPSENVSSEVKQNLASIVSVFPNPVITVTTVEYEILKEGKVLVELRDRKGELLKTVKNDFHEKGKYNVTISLETFNGELFYVAIKDENGLVDTKKILRVSR